jgi:hypothetical protein
MANQLNKVKSQKYTQGIQKLLPLGPIGGYQNHTISYTKYIRFAIYTQQEFGKSDNGSDNDEWRRFSSREVAATGIPRIFRL